MTIEYIKSLKDKVYELEGLLELAQMREDKLGELEPLIISRLKGLSVQENHEDEIIEDEPAVGGLWDNQEMPARTEPPVTVSGEWKPASVPEPVRKPAFCLNDRFRFRRELFDNSDAAFQEAMNKVAMMDSFEEAEEYFLEELGWSLENQEVTDFLEIIRNYFEA